MKLWGQYPDLAVFPGSLLLDDDRTGDTAYPSAPLAPEQLKTEEPGLSDAACKDGARLYKPEGITNNTSYCSLLNSHFKIFTDYGAFVSGVYMTYHA